MEEDQIHHHPLEHPHLHPHKHQDHPHLQDLQLVPRHLEVAKINGMCADSIRNCAVAISSYGGFAKKLVESAKNTSTG